MAKLSSLSRESIQQQADITAKEILTSKEAAQYMGVSLSQLHKLTMARAIPFSKPSGKLCYFNRRELERWMMSKRVNSKDELQEVAATYMATGRMRKGGAL
jgi:excisionase family DNA binding protein